MNILIAYATTEGQTRKISRFCADHLVAAGHSVELLSVGDGAGLDLGRFDAAILAGSVHLGHLQSELADFAKSNAEALNNLKTLLICVSLAAAGEDAGEHADLDRIAAEFGREAGWVPGQVAQVAGAFRFTQYDFFRHWAMRWIAAQKGEDVDPKADKEYTDWEALAAVLKLWAAEK